MNPFDCIFEERYNKKIELLEKLNLLTTDLDNLFNNQYILADPQADKAAIHLAAIKEHLVHLRKMT